MAGGFVCTRVFLLLPLKVHQFETRNQEKLVVCGRGDAKPLVGTQIVVGEEVK